MDEEEKTPITFKVEVKVDIKFYDASIDAEKLDSWINLLETYFILRWYSSEDKVSFAMLKMTNHALARWNIYKLVKKNK